jgi:esterase/lipase
MNNVILLHGALGSKQDLNPLAESLKKQNIHVHFCEFSGHGETAFRDKFNIPQFTGELAAFILQNSLAPAAIFGYSMGGYVALNLAQQEPGLINKIITLGTKFNWTNEIAAKETSMLDPSVIKEKVPKFAKVLEQKHNDGWEELLVRTAGLMNDIAASQYLNTTSFAGIKVPVLIGLADRDKMVSYEETAQVYKTLPNAGMYMLPHTQHPIETVNASLLSNIIAEFINRA